MAFAAETGANGEEEITFLFQVSQGVAHRSYGLNVARLARVPKGVIDTAAVKSLELEEQITEKKLGGLARMMKDIVGGTRIDHLDDLVVGIEQL